MIGLEKKKVVYITRDIERACGFGLDTSHYYIISNLSDFAKEVSKGHDNVLLVDEEKQLDTWELLKNEKVIKFIDNALKGNKNTPPTKGELGGVLVFKNTSQIEKICKENNWKLLNPPAELSNKIEEKISGLEWLENLQKYLPEHKVKLCKNITWENAKFIIQFNHAHSGLGTILIESNDQLEEIKQKFPERPVKITKHIEGPIFTSNNIVTKNKTLVGNISYQITGLKPFTDNPFTTIGNDWGYPHKYLNGDQIKKYYKIVDEIGNKLHAEGWKGLFGIDVVVDENSGEIYLIEINARQPASTTYESQLQSNIRNKKTTKIQNELTTFEAHLNALLDLEVEELGKIKDGAQIIIRNKEKGIRNKKETAKDLRKENFKIVEYDNIKPGSDLLRIQNKTSFMESHNKFNEKGKLILKHIA